MKSPLLIALGAVGVLFIWSAVYGANITGTFRDLLAGRSHLPDVTS